VPRIKAAWGHAKLIQAITMKNMKGMKNLGLHAFHDLHGLKISL
jgi:hypothetical protein